MGNGNIVVGNKSPTREPGQPITERLPGNVRTSEPAIDKQDSLTAQRPRICGAMSQQRGDGGNDSAPQKFVQLVGCRSQGPA